MRKKITEFEKAFILINRDKLTIDQLSDKLKGVDKKSIQKFLDEHPVESNTRVEPSMPNVDDLLVKKSGTVVMTEAASLLGEELQKNIPKRTHINGCTTKAKSK
jgi:hypothetical protein